MVGFRIDTWILPPDWLKPRSNQNQFKKLSSRDPLMMWGFSILMTDMIHKTVWLIRYESYLSCDSRPWLSIKSVVAWKSKIEVSSANTRQRASKSRKFLDFSRNFDFLNTNKQPNQNTGFWLAYTQLNSVTWQIFNYRNYFFVIWYCDTVSHFGHR